MVPNGSAYANYPSFANNGTKTPPGGSTESAKYALGMVPADTFPAEWANYLFHGATAGITRLNQDTGSIKKEINTVLDNFNITPDATLNNQLLAALNKLKADAALAAHPVGSLYWTSVNENPATTFGGGTWVQIKDRFILAAGDTYTAGDTGGSATVTLTEQQIPSHTHKVTASGKIGDTTATGTVSSHTHSVGAHAHGLNEHTHSFSGSQSHRHKLVSMNDNVVGSETVGMGYDKNGYKAIGVSGVSGGSTYWGNTHFSYYDTSSSNTSKTLVENTIVTISGTTGKASGNTANSTAFDSGSTQPTFTGDAHNHTFTGTEATSLATGGGQAHDNMPPYIVQYCWKRTA